MRITDQIRRFVQKFIDSRNARRRDRIAALADSIFQVRERAEDLWLTFDGRFVAPFSAITEHGSSEECIELVKLLRKLYIVMNS